MEGASERRAWRAIRRILRSHSRHWFNLNNSIPTPSTVGFSSENLSIVWRWWWWWLCRWRFSWFHFVFVFRLKCALFTHDAVHEIERLKRFLRVHNFAQTYNDLLFDDFRFFVISFVCVCVLVGDNDGGGSDGDNSKYAAARAAERREYDGVTNGTGRNWFAFQEQMSTSSSYSSI